MGELDKRTEEKITNILKWAYEDGIEYSETVEYIINSKSTSNANKSKLSKLLFANGLTQQMIKDFVEKNNYDILTLIDKIENKNETEVKKENRDNEGKENSFMNRENPMLSDAQIDKIVSETLKVWDRSSEQKEQKEQEKTKTSKSEQLKKSDERLMRQIVHAIKSLQDKGIEDVDIETYLNGNITVGIDNKEIDRILYTHRLTKQMINNYIRRNNYDITQLVEEFENAEIEFTRLDVEKIKKEKPKIYPDKESKIEKKEELKAEKDTNSEEIEIGEIPLEVPEYEEEIKFEDLEVPEYEEKQENEKQENETMEEEIDKDNIKPELTEKAKALLAKAELLTAKVEQEKNPIKRYILAFRIKQTLKKVQKEIDLQNIRSKYELKKKQLEAKREKTELGNEEKIAETTAEIKQLKKELKGNEEYDYESKNFMYPKEHVQKNGGLEPFSKKLQKSKSVETQNAGQKIELMANKRKKLEKLNEKLNTYKAELRNNDNKYNKKVSGLEFQQKSLIVAEKVNIFTWIRSTFSNITSQVKSYFEEKRQNKELQTKQLQEEQELEDTYYKQIEELKEKLEKAKQEMKEKSEADRQSKIEQNGKDMADSFKEQISNMKNYSQVPDEVENDEKTQEEENKQEQGEEQEI